MLTRCKNYCITISSLVIDGIVWCIAVLHEEASSCLLQPGKNCRMSGCSAFSRIIWTCTKYTQLLKYLPTHQRWFYSFHVGSIRAVAESSCRVVSSESYIDGIRASRSCLRHMPRYFSDKADDKTEAPKESSPELLRRFNQTWHTLRYFSDKADDKTEAAKESSPGLWRRFHQTYKEHGKILICVHLVTSAVWASIFYFAAVRYILF